MRRKRLMKMELSLTQYGQLNVWYYFPVYDNSDKRNAHNIYDAIIKWIWCKYMHLCNVMHSNRMWTWMETRDYCARKEKEYAVRLKRAHTHNFYTKAATNRELAHKFPCT